MFKFKQFQVEHDRSSMKVGTDGVLLGSWCDVSHASSVLDVGTGCGLIAMMIAQRNATATIDAIDIDADSVQEATGNFATCPWSERLHAVHADFTTYECPKNYDLIVSNPPFFTNGILSPQESRKNARHTLSLTYDQLLAKARSLLTDDGIISIVSPADVVQVILDACKANSLYVNEMVDVIPLENAQCKRVLWEIGKMPVEIKHTSLTIEKFPGEYTEEYIALCKDFYLKF